MMTRTWMSVPRSAQLPACLPPRRPAACASPGFRPARQERPPCKVSTPGCKTRHSRDRGCQRSGQMMWNWRASGPAAQSLRHEQAWLMCWQRSGPGPAAPHVCRPHVRMSSHQTYLPSGRTLTACTCSQDLRDSFLPPHYRWAMSTPEMLMMHVHQHSRTCRSRQLSMQQRRKQQSTGLPPVWQSKADSLQQRQRQRCQQHQQLQWKRSLRWPRLLLVPRVRQPS
mmetsp:Transcript_16183/g.48137  ORF Transcript_16183/g.48137 Transcript_16183/m.48137 type:complete len:225 (-) Transcript_16183:2812-3486(-)